MATTDRVAPVSTGLVSTSSEVMCTDDHAPRTLARHAASSAATPSLLPFIDRDWRAAGSYSAVV